MTLPGFSAETSLFKTSTYYRLTGAWIKTDGVVPQQDGVIIDCPFPCYSTHPGSCLQDCSACSTDFGFCVEVVMPCDPSECSCTNPLLNPCAVDWDGTTLVNICDCDPGRPNCSPCQPFPYIGPKQICKC
jgi:hypothetical protein